MIGITKEDIFAKLQKAVLTYNEKSAGDIAKEALEEGIDPITAIEKGLTIGLQKVGERFEREEVWLPEVLLAVDAMNAGLNILIPKINTKKKYRVGKIVIGTIKGDVHDIGKNIVASMLLAAGFKVYDLGKDVPPRTFIQKAEEIGADIIAVSALVTTTRPVMSGIVAWLKKMGIRDKYKVVVGGGSVTPEFASQIGADGYAKNAIEAVKVAKRLLGVK